jgi:hypothetical protein
VSFGIDVKLPAASINTLVGAAVKIDELERVVAMGTHPLELIGALSILIIATARDMESTRCGSNSRSRRSRTSSSNGRRSILSLCINGSSSRTTSRSRRRRRALSSRIITLFLSPQTVIDAFLAQLIAAFNARIQLTAFQFHSAMVTLGCSDDLDLVGVVDVWINKLTIDRMEILEKMCFVSTE